MPDLAAKGPPLLIDAMLGNLARRLRWIGYDAEYRNDLSDDAMMQIARDEGRVLVTRDRALAARRGLRSLHLDADGLDDQVRAVTAALGPAPGPARCTVCNGELKPLTPLEASTQVPPYVAATQTDFAVCLRCHRVYWPGTHWPGLQSWRIQDARTDSDSL